jgi:hypothetical protein
VGGLSVAWAGSTLGPGIYDENQSVVDALNDYLGGLDPALLRSLEDDALAELASVFPSLSRHAEEPVARGVDSERYRTQYAIRSLLERLSAPRSCGRARKPHRY